MTLSAENLAIVAKRRERRDVLLMCSEWKPEGMALITFLFLATGLQYRGRRSVQRRQRGWGDNPENLPDRRSYGDDRRRP